jgi:hypothetical protein
MKEIDTPPDTEDEFSQSFQRILTFAKRPEPSMEVMTELGVLFRIYRTLKKQYEQEDIESRKRKKNAVTKDTAPLPQS